MQETLITIHQSLFERVIKQGITFKTADSRDWSADTRDWRGSMMMTILSAASLCLLVYARLCVGQISAPFIVKVQIEGDTDRSLQCETLTGFPVEEAVFFRNGIQVSTTDGCVNASHDGMRPFNNTPECDGHYSCGRSESGALVLSGPKTVLGKLWRLYSQLANSAWLMILAFI